jgi:hypothetical protein
MATTPDADSLVEVYRTDSRLVAQKVLDTLFAPESIFVAVHDRLDAMLPGSGQPGGLYLAVERADRERAVAILTEAHQNGYLDGEEGEQIE